jgi:hypothetical protein
MASSTSNTLPNSTDEIRQRLFNLAAGEDITIPAASWCRLYGKPSNPFVPREDRNRNDPQRHLTECPCKINIVRQHRDGIVTISRSSQDGHNHGYEDVAWKPLDKVLKL